MKILIAYDGSECSDAAVIDLQRAGLPSDAEVLVLSMAEMHAQVAAAPYGAMVVGPGVFAPAGIETEPCGRRLEEAQAFADQAAKRLRADFPKWQIKTEAWVDAAEAGILRTAHAWRPDLVVVGSHGRSGVRRLLLGSVSQYVLHHLQCSVRISRHHLHSQRGPIRLLIGIDGSKGAKAALQAVGARNWPAGTEAPAMGVMDCGLLESTPFTVTPEAIPMAVEERWRNHLSTTLRGAELQLNQSGLLATYQVLAGKPAKVLVEEAEKWEADSVFVGARGLNRLERMLRGSVSTAVASQSHCSVEVVSN